MLKSLIYHLSMGVLCKPPVPPPPGPMEIAVNQLALTQRQLLAATLEYEQVEAHVNMLASRITRLQSDIQLMMQPAEPSAWATYATPEEPGD